MYQFFHVKEELRTARVSALVVALAVACWAPHFFVLFVAGTFIIGKVSRAGH